MKPTVSFVVPCFNESDNIENFYNHLHQVCFNQDFDWEIIFVNDGSRDNTYSKMVLLNKADPRVKVINLSRNFGKEIALTAGIDACSGDCAIPMDVDMQDPPEVAIEMIAKWREGYDVVYGIRDGREGETFLKKLTAYVFYRVIRYISRTKIPNDTGDFRVMDRKVINALKEIREYHRFMKGIFTWVGFNQIGIKYKRKARFSGKSKYNYIKLVNFAIEGITSFTVAPLRFATIMGLFVSMLSMIYAGFIVIRTITMGVDVPGYSSIMVTLLFLGGIQLLSIGVIGEYIGRIFNETKNRPLYIVLDKIGFSNG